MYASAGEVRRQVAELFRPARRLLPSEAAAKSLVDHKNGQHWDPSAAPYMVEPLDSMASREYEATIVIGPSRSSKSFSMVQGGLTYIITCDPADTSVIHMNQIEAQEYSKAEVDRMFKASPDLAAKLGSAAGDNNIGMKLMRDGMALRMAHPSIGSVSSKTLRWMFITDADNLTGDLKLPQLFPLAAKRTQTFLSSGHTIVEGNPAVDYVDAKWLPATPHEGPPASGLAALYNSGDRRRFYWFCPECGEPFHVKPGLAPFALVDRMPLEELKELALSANVRAASERLARVVCTANGCEITHRAKREMNQRGRWLREGVTMDRHGEIEGAPVVSRRATFWIAGAMAAYQSWESIIEQYLLAVKHYAVTREDGQIKQRLNTDLAWPHLPMVLRERRSDAGLSTRAKPSMKGFVPGGVRFLVAAVDVQSGGFVVQVEGIGIRGEKWIVDRYFLRTSARTDGKGGYLPMDPAAFVEDWDRLTEKVVERRYPLSDKSGRTMPIMRTHIDMGGRAKATGKVTERAYQYWRRLKEKGKHRRVRLVKGTGAATAPRILERFPDTSGRKDRSSGSMGDVPVLFINTNIVKDAIDADLRRDMPGPGYFNFPDWLPQSFYDELRAETRTESGWQNLSDARNESFDLATYNHAAFLALKGDTMDWDSPPGFAADWESNSELQGADGEPPKAVARRAPRRPITIGSRR